MKSGDVKIVFNHSDKVRKSITGETLKKAAFAGGFVIEANAKINVNNTFSSKATGGAGLGGSIQTVIAKAKETYAEVSVGPTVIYGRIHELGGIILPVHAKLLSWIGDNGEHIFAKRVQIPARPYLRPAVDEHEKEIRDAVGFQIEKQIKAALK